MTKDQASGIQSNGPLTGIRVLELGNMIAAPTAGTQFADFGAEVVKVEHPVHGDDLRQWPPNNGDVPLWWKVTNRNKKLITVDLSTGEGAATIRNAVPEFDIVLENFRPGTLERWGIGPDVLMEINPQLIVARISGYGQTGPYSKRGGYGTVAEAISGIPSFTGPKDGPPTLSAFPLVDVLAGHSAVQGALMALHERSRSGLGQVVDVSLYESLFRLADAQVIGYDQAGIVKQRNGNRMDEDSPRNTYETADTKWIAISAGSQRTFSRLAAAIGRPELTQDPRFNTNRNRVIHAEELDSIMAEWFRPRTSAEAMEIMLDNDVVAGLVYTIADIFEDPHFAARENIIELEDKQLGSVRMQNVSPKLSRTPGRVRWTGGEMGDDNEEMLARFATVNR